MKIHFLGTNGWYATKTGNVICTLIDCEEGYIVLDAGDGIHKLKDYLKEDKPIYLFLSHLHLDHIYGFHIFPSMIRDKKITVILEKGNAEILKKIANHPFTSPPRENISFHEVEKGKHDLPIKFDCLPLSHVEPTLGYRLYLEDKVISYCLDTGVCDNVVKLSKEADIFITECSNLPGVSNPKWGHINSEEAAVMAKKASAKKMILIHLNVNFRNKKEKKEVEKNARKVFKNTQVAEDDLIVKI